MFQNFLNPLKQVTTKSNHHTSSWVVLDQALAAGICILLYSLCQGDPHRAQVETGIGLHHLGKPKACTPSRQLQTTLDHHTTTSIIHGRDGCWPGVTASTTSYLDWVNSPNWLADSNQVSSTRGKSTHLTWRDHLEYKAWEIGVTVPLDPTGHILH